jgi:two-component system nitrogen regulation sensor histidine kinase NtrY
VGLPARGRERLTEPYVTTREKGTGLGLAIVKRILEEHGGDLELTDARTLPGARAVLAFPRPLASADAAAV